MRVTQFTRTALRVRREAKQMKADGWELVGEGGGKLWELQRGWRWREVITDMKIAADGKSLWIKTGEPATG